MPYCSGSFPGERRTRRRSFLGLLSNHAGALFRFESLRCIGFIHGLL